jgi:hypothetical protein
VLKENKMKNAKNTFEVGKTYWTRSVCDSECIITITVAKRTAKFLTTTEGKRLGISSWDGVEHVKPWGTYSMAPIISADKVTKSNRPEGKTN